MAFTDPIPVVVNNSSGRQDTTADQLAALDAALRIDERDPAQVVAAVRAYVRDGTPIVGVAGGDGSLRSAAEVLVGTGTTLLPVPAGTRNHFAKLAGIDTIERVPAALAEGEVVPFDVGRMGDDAVFLNNASIGWYAELVADRDQLTSRWGRQLARVLSMVRHVPRAHRFRVTIEGETHRAWVVFIGNGEHGLGPLSLTERERPTHQRLDVRVLRAEGRFARVRVAFAVLVGRAEESDFLVRVTASEITLTLRRPANIALDGEVMTCDRVVSVRVEPAALRVLTLPLVTDETA
jgi:undecaprenyl-diphosphatase